VTSALGMPLNGRLLLVEGPPGIGKTRLLGAITERAGANGMRTFRAQAGEFERSSREPSQNPPDFFVAGP
jgi:predicted ATP-dependent serine protease